MKKNKYFIIRLLVLNLLISFFFAKYLVMQPSDTSSNYIIRDSGYWDLTGTPIFINGSADGVGAQNWTWFESQTWYGGGDGSLNTPYIIENITIDGLGSGNCIEIVDSEDHFTIRNCTVFNSGSGTTDAGINFYNVTNAKVIDNDCSSNLRQGIILQESNGIIILNNEVNSNDYHGIGVYSSHFTNISENNINNNERRGIDISYSDFTKIINNGISNNWASGIFVNFCNYSLFMENIIYGNAWWNNANGITTSSSSHSVIKNNNIVSNYAGISSQNCINNTYIDNELAANELWGLDLGNSNDCQVAYNSMDHNTWGLYLNQGDYNDILDNTASHNLYTGILVNNNCNNNTIFSNEVNSNYEHGIYIISSDNNNITGNSINYNNLNGLFLSNSDNNYVIENILIGNNNCIYELNCFGNILTDNTCTELFKLFVDILHQIFTMDSFNITFFISNDETFGINVDSLQMWWDGTDVSSSVQNIGIGMYFVALTPITVQPGDPPIILNITITSNGFEDKDFEISIAVDPDLIDEGEPGSPFPAIPGYNIHLITVIIIIGTIYLLNKKKKTNK